MQSAPDAVTGTPRSSPPSVPAPGLRVLLFSVVALAAGFGAATWLNALRLERFAGYVQARVQNLAAGRDARIAQVLVSPGTVVAHGQPIVVLEDQELEQRLKARRQEIESLEIELARTRAALEVQLEIQQRDIRDRIFETKLRSVQLLRELAAPGDPPVSTRFGDQWISRAPRMIAHPPRATFHIETRIMPAMAEEPASINRVIPHRGESPEVALCAERIAELERLSEELPQKISRSIGIDLAQARLDHTRTALAALEQQQKELTIVARTAGMIGVFHKQVGDRVAAHEPIVQLLDEEQPYLMLQFPSPRISDFTPGTIVELKFPGGERGRGRVESIPPQTSDLPEAGGTTRETTITAHIDPIGRVWPNVPFGSVVEVYRRR